MRPAGIAIAATLLVPLAFARADTPMPIIPLFDLCQQALNNMRPGDWEPACVSRERDALTNLKAKWPSTPEIVRQACLRFDAYSTISTCIDDLLPKYRDEAWRKLQGR